MVPAGIAEVLPDLEILGVIPDEILELGKFYGCPVFYWAGGQMQATYQPEQGCKLNRALAFTSWESHAFFYSSAKPIANLTGKRRATVATDTKKTLPPFEEWHEWRGDFKPGHWTADDLMVVRRQFLESGRNAKVSLRNMAEYSQLSYRCTKKADGEVGLCTVRERPQDSDDIVRWLARLPREIEYNGERLAAISLKVFLTLLKSERIYLDKDQKEAILKKQDNRCNMCGGVFDGTHDQEWDHIAALRQTLKGQAQVFQCICSSCHQDKTGLESRQDANITSYFNKRAWDCYVQSPRLPPLVPVVILKVSGEA